MLRQWEHNLMRECLKWKIIFILASYNIYIPILNLKIGMEINMICNCYLISSVLRRTTWPWLPRWIFLNGEFCHWLGAGEAKFYALWIPWFLGGCCSMGYCLECGVGSVAIWQEDMGQYYGRRQHAFTIWTYFVCGCVGGFLHDLMLLLKVHNCHMLLLFSILNEVFYFVGWYVFICLPRFEIPNVPNLLINASPTGWKNSQSNQIPSLSTQNDKLCA